MEKSSKVIELSKANKAGIQAFADAITKCQTQLNGLLERREAFLQGIIQQSGEYDGITFRINQDLNLEEVITAPQNDTE